MIKLINFRKVRYLQSLISINTIRLLLIGAILVPISFIVHRLRFIWEVRSHWVPVAAVPATATVSSFDLLVVPQLEAEWADQDANECEEIEVESFWEALPFDLASFELVLELHWVWHATEVETDASGDCVGTNEWCEQDSNVLMENTTECHKNRWADAHNWPIIFCFRNEERCDTQLSKQEASDKCKNDNTPFL